MTDFMESPLFDIAINPRFRGKLPAGDSSAWWRYNNTFETRTLSPIQLAREIWKGYSYTAPHAKVRHPVGKTKSGHTRWSAYRRAENWQSAQHLALDFDEGDETSDPEVLARDPFIKKHGSFIHTTSSSTLKHPKSRAVFILDTPYTDAEKYGEASAALTWKFSGRADSACSDPARVFFGAHHCDVIRLGNILPKEVVESIVSEFNKYLEGERRRQPKRRSIPTESLALKAQMVEDALRRIPPRGAYDDWLRVLMAVHSALPGPIGEILCENWSPGYPGEISYKFGSFSESGNGKGAVTLGTLYWMASSHGWDRIEAIQRIAGPHMVPEEGEVF